MNNDRLADKWTEEIIDQGFTAVPNLLLNNRELLGISTSEFYMLIVIEMYRWTSDRPWPSLRELSKASGFSTRQVSRLTQGLESLGLLTRIKRANTSNLYDVQPLIDELDRIANPQKWRFIADKHGELDLSDLSG